MDFTGDPEKHNTNTDQRLHKASQLYINGNYKESLNTLKNVCFAKFDIKEWIFENNILMCKIKIHQLNDSCEISDSIVNQLRELLQKIRGLPSQILTLPLEISAGLNYSFVLLAGHMNKKVTDGCFQAGAVLTNNIIRVTQAHGSVVDLPDLKATTSTKAFASNVISTILELVCSFFDRKLGSDYTDLVVINCWMLAVLWLSQHYVDAGFKMLEMLRSHLENSKETASVQRVIVMDPSINKNLFPVTLLSQASSHADLKALVVFQTSLCFTFCQKDNKQALDLLNTLPSDSSSISINFFLNYLKGCIHYQQDEGDQAMKYFIQCREFQTQSNHRAAILCMTGCCLARQGKPHTAIAKFKEALHYNFGHFDALFYTAQQYQNLGQADAEIQILQYLCAALCSCKDSVRSVSLLHGSFIPFIDNLYGKTICLTYALYWLGKRCLVLKRFCEASSAFMDVIKLKVSTRQPQISKSLFILPSLNRIYRDCAVALLKAEQFKDCVTICDTALGDLLIGDALNETKSSAQRKRPRESKENEVTDECFDQLELLLCKAYAVLRMDQPLISLQCLQRFFDEIESSLVAVRGNNNTDDSKVHKRRRLDIDTHTAIETILFKEKKDVKDEGCFLLKMKSQAHMIRSYVLLSMDKVQESLEELYQSILFDEDNVSAVLQYSRLLLKLGSAKVVASNWIKYRELYCDRQSCSVLTSREDCNERLPFAIEVTDKELQEMDNQLLQ